MLLQTASTVLMSCVGPSSQPGGDCSRCGTV